MLFFENTAQFFSRFSRWNLLFFGIAAGAVPVLAFVINLPIFHQALPRLGAFGLAVGLGAIFLRAYFLSLRASISLGWGTSLAGSLLGSASLYLVLSYIPEISTYPFTLTWSEASRYYYASLYFSERIYGIQTPPTVLHPSRYLMQAIPFLLPEFSNLAPPGMAGAALDRHANDRFFPFSPPPEDRARLAALAVRGGCVPGLDGRPRVLSPACTGDHRDLGLSSPFDPLAQKSVRNFCAGCLRRFSLGRGQQGELVPGPRIDGIGVNLDGRTHRIRRSPPKIFLHSQAGRMDYFWSCDGLPRPGRVHPLVREFR